MIACDVPDRIRLGPTAASRVLPAAAVATQTFSLSEVLQCLDGVLPGLDRTLPRAAEHHPAAPRFHLLVCDWLQPDITTGYLDRSQPPTRARPDAAEARPPAQRLDDLLAPGVRHPPREAQRQHELVAIPQQSGIVVTLKNEGVGREAVVAGLDRRRRSDRLGSHVHRHAAGARSGRGDAAPQIGLGGEHVLWAKTDAVQQTPPEP